MNFFRSCCILFLFISFGLVAEEEKNVAAAELSVEKSSSGSSTYDAESIQELYEQYKKENEGRDDTPKLIGDMESFVLDNFEVHTDEVGHDSKELFERLDPKPRNRINRIARVNPDAAAEIQHALRSDEVFFSKESLPGGSSDTGQTADFSAKQIVDAFSKIGSLFGGKKKETPDDVR